MIVDKVRRAEDLELLNTLPEDYLDNLKLNVPEHLLKLLADCMRLFLIKTEIEEEKVDAITEKLYQRRFVDMFDVQFSFKEIRETERKEKAIEIAQKMVDKGYNPQDILELIGISSKHLREISERKAVYSGT